MEISEFWNGCSRSMQWYTLKGQPSFCQGLGHTLTQSACAWMVTNTLTSLAARNGHYAGIHFELYNEASDVMPQITKRTLPFPESDPWFCLA